MKSLSYPLSKIRICIFLCLSLPITIFSQGLLQGVVSDSTSSEPLVGANIHLLGTAIGGVTDLEGKYRITNVPAGSYFVRLSYLGYIAKVIPLVLHEDQTHTINVSLIPDVIEGNEVIITAQARGQVAAINQQLTSNTIINVVSEEKIKELPDANAAESIGRLPGVSILRSGGEANKVLLRGLDAKFTSVTIDGVKIPPTDPLNRSVDLSMLSQSSLAGIELFKALTPDKDGDALAGTINLVTRKAPDVREFRADIKGNYNHLMESANQYDLSLHYGERFYDNIVGVQVTGNFEKKIRSNERTAIEYNYLDKTNWSEDNFRLEFTDETRKRNGGTLLFDISTPDDGSIRISTMYGETKRDYLWSTREFPIVGGGSQQGQPVYNYRLREQSIKTFNSSMRGDNTLFTLSVTWGLSFAQSDAYYPFDYEGYFVEPNGMNNPGTTVYRGDPVYLASLAVNNFSLARLDWAYYRTQDNFDKEKTAFADIAKHYSFLNEEVTGEIKFGGKYKIKDRSNYRGEDAAAYYIGVWKEYEKLPDGTIRKKDFSGTAFEAWLSKGGGAIYLSDFIDGDASRDVYSSYRLFPLINRDKLRQWRELNKYGYDASGSTSEIWTNDLIKYDDYNISESVTAGYIMNTLNIGQDITFIAGVRVETEHNDYHSRYMPVRIAGFPLPPNSTKDTSNTFSQTIFLPNTNLSLRLFDFMNLRLAAYKAIGRPDFNMRLDRYIAGRPAEVSGSQQVYVGNPNLKSSQAWNYEINASFFGNNIGLISVSAYYKEIEDMFHMLNNFNTNNLHVNGDSVIQSFGIKWNDQYDVGTAYNLTLPYNSPKPAKVWGFEFEHQINFKFLPGFLQYFILSYNASLVRSEAHLFVAKPDSIFYDPPGPRPPLWDKFTVLELRKQRLEGMPDFFGNISLGYDIGDFSARISLFHKAQHDVSSGASGISDRVSIPFTRLDASLKQKITDFLSIFVNLNNLTNSEDGTKIYSRNNVPQEFIGRTLFDQSEQYGFTGDFGVTVEF
ncbi:MAG: TonB-dependent receptor [Bacteroidota bacterium]